MAKGNAESNSKVDHSIKRLRKKLCGGLFDNFDQHDCQEFLKLLIYTVHEENSHKRSLARTSYQNKKTCYENYSVWLEQ